jgi:hypothetical protein
MEQDPEAFKEVVLKLSQDIERQYSSMSFLDKLKFGIRFFTGMTTAKVAYSYGGKFRVFSKRLACLANRKLQLASRCYSILSRDLNILRQSQRVLTSLSKSLLNAYKFAKDSLNRGVSTIRRALRITIENPQLVTETGSITNTIRTIARLEE